MKEFGKKDLRTGYRMTVKWKTLGEQQYLVLLNTENGDIIANEGGWDELNDDLIFYSGIVLKIERPTHRNVFNTKYETIYERTDELPYNAWYSLKGYPDFMAFYTDENTAFGFDFTGKWHNLSDGWSQSNSDNLIPVPTEEWKARLIEYAEERGYVKGATFKAINYNYFAGGGSQEQKIQSSDIFIDDYKDDEIALWVNTGDYNSVLFTASEGWAEIITPEYNLSTEQLIEIIKKRTGANHVQILMDKQ